MKQKNAIITIIFLTMLLMGVASAVDCSPNPDHLEICDNKDNDCDGLVDENCKIIIWYHRAWEDPNYLQNVVDSGLVTHIMITNSNRNENWTSNPTITNKISQAIQIIRNSNPHIKIIWGRDLWPIENQTGIELEDFFNSSYYAQEISFLKKEAAELGADFISLDTEPYGTSPMKQYLTGNRTLLTSDQNTELANAIKTATAAEGRVDFIYPAGSSDMNHPYHELAKLGTLTLAENTYYDKEVNIPYSYDLFGAFVNSEPGNLSGNPNAPYYTIQTIFDKSYRWINKKGLWFYQEGESNAIKISEQLLAYSHDLDKDGFAFDVDCNGSNNLIYPGATEVCDGTDNDCDGETDEGNVCCGNQQCDASETFETCQADCPQECIDTTKLMSFIGQWKRGEISMLTLMQKIRQRNAGTGCLPA